MSQSKIALLQRQQAFQRDAINNEHKLVKICKDQIKWLKGVPDIASTKTRIDGLYKHVEASKKRIAKLVEMQKFTKGQLQGAYNTIELSKWEQLGTWRHIESYFDSLNCVANLPERVGIDGTKYEWQISEGLRKSVPKVSDWEYTPSTFTEVSSIQSTLRHDLPHPSIMELWHKTEQDRNNEFKHTPKFMECAPAVEMGSVVGDEL